MIKVLHYCWFGGNPLPQSAIEYMKSWEKYCPDFAIKRWDETNFDIDSVPFVREAYEAKKWAFVSDYVRTYALYMEGGLYVDTDVEFIKSIDDLIDRSFMGFENPEIINPGLILYAEKPRSKIYEEILSYYDNLHFNDNNKSAISSPNIFTKILVRHGLKLDNTMQRVDDIMIYPTEYFQPLGDKRYKIKKRITDKTRTIHHYDASWLDKTSKKVFLYKMRYGNFWGRVVFAMKHPIAAMKRLRNK